MADIEDRGEDIVEGLEDIKEFYSEIEDSPFYKKALKDKVQLTHVILKDIVENEEKYKEFKKYMKKKPVDEFSEDSISFAVDYLANFMYANGYKPKETSPLYKQFEKFVDRVYKSKSYIFYPPVMVEFPLEVLRYGYYVSRLMEEAEI